jgi:hypothetical protein
MNRNLVGSNYGRSSINFAHFVPIHLQTWPPQAILVSDWLIFFNLLLCGQAASEEKLFYKSTNKKQELPMMAMFVNGSKRNEQFPYNTFICLFFTSSSTSL